MTAEAKATEAPAEVLPAYVSYAGSSMGRDFGWGEAQHIFRGDAFRVAKGDGRLMQRVATPTRMGDFQPVTQQEIDELYTYCPLCRIYVLDLKVHHTKVHIPLGTGPLARRADVQRELEKTLEAAEGYAQRIASARQELEALDAELAILGLDENGQPLGLQGKAS